MFNNNVYLAVAGLGFSGSLFTGGRDDGVVWVLVTEVWRFWVVDVDVGLAGLPGFPLLNLWDGMDGWMDGWMGDGGLIFV